MRVSVGQLMNVLNCMAEKGSYSPALWNWAALRIWGKVEVFGSMGPRGLQNIAEIPWGLLVVRAVEHLGAALACAELGRGNSLSWPAEHRRAGFSSCKCAFCFSIP